MKIHNLLAGQKGFSLITIVILFTILGVMTVGGITLSLKLQAAGKNRNTVDKMTVIADALQKYYRGHYALPPAVNDFTVKVASVDVPFGVPVDALNLEQHFRYDAWGRFFYYDPGDVTDITDILVEEKPVGAVLFSSGPDQIPQSGNISPYTTMGDDILGPVNLREQAIEITLIEMRVLQKKLWAWALNQCPSTPSVSPIDIFVQFGLGDEFQKDAWLEPYTIGIAEIRSSGPDEVNGNSDDLVLASLDVTCPGPPEPDTIIAEGGFNENGQVVQTDIFRDGILDNGVQIEGDPPLRSAETHDGVVLGKRSLDLDGSSNYVSLGNTQPSLNPGNGTYAIDVWIKIDANATGKRVIYGSHSSDLTKIEFFVDGDPLPPLPPLPVDSKSLVFRVEDSSGNYVQARSNDSLSTGVWHHVVATWNPQFIQLYHNDFQYPATLTSSPDIVGNLESDSDYYIGRDDTGNYYFGLIDEILIYNF